MRNWLGEN